MQLHGYCAGRRRRRGRREMREQEASRVANGTQWRRSKCRQRTKSQPWGEVNWIIPTPRHFRNSPSPLSFWWFFTTKLLVKLATFAAVAELRRCGVSAAVMEDRKTTSSSTFGAPRTSRRRRSTRRGRDEKKYGTATRDKAPVGRGIARTTRE